MKLQRPSRFSDHGRAMTGTEWVMIWERILPALAPIVVSAALIAVAGQWGLFALLVPLAHAGVLAGIVIVTVVFVVRGLMGFKRPTFQDIIARLALDNGYEYHKVLGMRHLKVHPKLKVAKPKAGLAQGDPMALRFVAALAAVLGFLIIGPVSINQVGAAFNPFLKDRPPAPAAIIAVSQNLMGHLPPNG
jgi:Domain of unknown function (DUF4175)